MDELMDMIVADESPSQISDKIKDILFAKTAEKIDAFRPAVASSLFGEDEVEVETEED
jgi:predicted oxidoreductase (fatty acid repression mutant protein)